ncbi:MAG: hypothetical protein KGD63_03610 [Candidatus Lokiarchaeota archaeon]|nr:hypothetical protein [Candidatus Lokiarchaeota archaeon]
MAINKIKKWYLVFFILVVLVFILNFIMGFFIPPIKIYRFSFFNNVIWDTLLFFILYILSPFLGYGLTYIVSPLFLRLHKFIFRKKHQYGIEDRPNNKDLKFNFIRLFFPALLTINLALILSKLDVIRELIIEPSIIENADDIIITMMVMIPLMGICAVISIVLFSAIYFLIDTGIIFTNKKYIENRPINTKVQSIGSWFLYILKGYSGISIILVFYEFYANIFYSVDLIDPITVFGIIILWPMMPFLITGVFIPLLPLLQRNFENRKQSLLKKARKMGITSYFEVIIKES